MIVKSFTRAGEMVSAPDEKPPFEGLRSAGLLLAIPALLIVSPLVGLFLGMAVDRWLKTGPAFAAVGVVLGFATAGREIYRIYRRYLAEEEERSKRR
jgi:F0F1-type ATP synthase assembly protein I